jgi:ATP-dependent Clp protease protease subunit
MNVASMDVFSRLMMDRIIFLGEGINDYVANIVTAQMLFLEQNDPEAPIHFYINSPGGSVYAGLGIYDLMQHVSCPVYTYCTGLAASMGSILLNAGTPGFRHAMPHARIMIHQPLGGARGQATDIEIQANEIQTLKKQLYNIYVKHSSTKKTFEEIWAACERDNYMTAEQAIAMGLIDKVITPKQKILK